jgi:hypothetical protein
MNQGSRVCGQAGRQYVVPLHVRTFPTPVGYPQHSEMVSGPKVFKIRGMEFALSTELRVCGMCMRGELQLFTVDVNIQMALDENILHPV